MDRRDFLKSSIASAALGNSVAWAGSSVAAASVTAGARRWVLALPQSLDVLEVRTTVMRLQHQLQAVFPQTTVAIETTVSAGIEAVTTGLADFYVGLDTQHASTHPALPIFAGLPLGADMPAPAHHAWLSEPGRALWAAALDAADVVATPVAHTGPSPGLYADVALEHGRSLGGIRIAARGLASDALRLLGADVSLHDADGNGGIAGRGLAAAEPLLSAFESKALWSFEPGLTPSGLTLTLGTRGSFWRRLSAWEQATISGLAAAALADSLALGEQRRATLEHVAAYRRWPMATAMPLALERDLRAAVDAALDQLAGRDRLARQAIASYRSFAARVG